MQISFSVGNFGANPHAGLSNMHGLRHAYAQNRYEEVTGWQCPAMGGPDSKALTPEQREADREARHIISQELGHARTAISEHELMSLTASDTKAFVNALLKPSAPGKRLQRAAAKYKAMMEGE